ncbi:unnamed protein product [Cylicocyclus nassatus]|uniref:Uncharacterized protein n=1 Tax=Cylicocyclus nassatus TaxID=53992 RepID=A0AA36GU83_CYLNA|nr:unnamed protein product [Cylicocyclus nassatus]
MQNAVGVVTEGSKGANTLIFDRSRPERYKELKMEEGSERLLQSVTLRRRTANELREESSWYISADYFERSCGLTIGEDDIDEEFGKIEESDEKEHEDENRRFI